MPQCTINQQLQLRTNQNTPRTSQLPVQSLPNPNNKTTQPIFNIELQYFPTYFIMKTPFQGVQLRLERVLQQETPFVNIEEDTDEEEDTNQPPNDDSL